MARSAHTVGEFVDQVARKAAGAKGQLWFRGCSKRSHTLRPGLFRVRPRNYTGLLDVASVLTLETDFIARFRERAQPYIEQVLPEADLELLVIMQHFGIPTRYLDWSESALVGLWFALEQRRENRARVWIMDPTAWNQAALSHNNYQRGVLSLSDPRLDGLAPQRPLDQMSIYPLATAGTYNNERIVGQRGAFTLAGKALEPMDALAGRLAREQGLRSTELVDSIDIPQAAVRSMYEELTGLGFGRAAIYPDLTNLAMEITATHCEGML